MELIYTEHKGLRVQATHLIECGSIVDEFVGQLTTSMRRASRSSYAMELHKLANTNQVAFIDASEVGGMARHTNHSCRPNCELVELKHRTAVRVAVVALFNIEPEVELIVFYSNRLLNFRCVCCVDRSSML